jgi:hypothetical protein
VCHIRRMRWGSAPFMVVVGARPPSAVQCPHIGPIARSALPYDSNDHPHAAPLWRALHAATQRHSPCCRPGRSCPGQPNKTPHAPTPTPNPKDDLEGKRVFVRADLNVPLDKQTLAITDDTRIRWG